MTSLRAPILALCALTSVAAFAQEGTDSTEQALVNLDALIIATQVTTRCAVHDAGFPYLTPLEWTAAEYHVGQMEHDLREPVSDLADQVARMRTEAADIECGHEGLVPFMNFGRQAAQDVIDTALLAWQEIRVRGCAYFRDDGFMEAVERAEIAAENFELATHASRASFIQNGAARWVAVFNANCANPRFDPTLTMPGLIALALPMDEDL